MPFDSFLGQVYEGIQFSNDARDINFGFSKQFAGESGSDLKEKRKRKKNRDRPWHLAIQTHSSSTARLRRRISGLVFLAAFGKRNVALPTTSLSYGLPGSKGNSWRKRDRDRGSLLGYIMRGWAGIAARSADKIDIFDIDAPGRKSSQVRASRESGFWICAL